ncbi:Bug family tripartite tricarboxylate transporter substrate binding protein [Rhodoplanes sp. Z2-YC6860]|uniref:Bug family tripartite tricarboxylate transporter substrate binding protein n=1 Tax=Rhodoplanes sp. Z2-YC6860 TaxID=674703 RepID=UPI000A030657|nr:tripartite tricarboxylate transporter substrate binding protein [Rhodoplanes sp. Z2-YC6860]
MMWVRGLVLAAALAAAAGNADAQPASYPTQMVRIVVPFSAGSITDGLARVLADKLAERWQQQVIVENRPGIAGTAYVAKAAPDGHTLMLTSNGHTIGAVVNKNLPYDPAKDFAGVTEVAEVPQALIVPPDLPAKNVTEFIALARKSPGKMNFSSAGLASTSYLGAELFKQTAKIDIVHIPNKGAPEAVTSVMRNDSQLFYLGVNLAVELNQSGKVRAIAVSTAKRSPALPDVPTVAESGLPDYKYEAWFAVMAPAGTPKPILNKVSEDIVGILRNPDVAEKLTRQGVEIVYSTPDKFDAVLKADVERNSAILRAAGVGAQ